MVSKRQLMAWTISMAAACLLPAVAVNAADAVQSPQELIQQVSTEVLDTIKADKSIQGGDLNRISALVDAKVMPHVDFERMTSAAVGRYWRQASAEQKTQLQAEFKKLLVRTYANAFAQVRDQTVALKPNRAQQTGDELVVRTEVKGSGDPIQLDYRMEKTAAGWKIYDVNVMGIWLVENYRNSFAQEIGQNGVDGLIKKLADRNKPGAAPVSAKG